MADVGEHIVLVWSFGVGVGLGLLAGFGAYAVVCGFAAMILAAIDL